MVSAVTTYSGTLPPGADGSAGSGPENGPETGLVTEPASGPASGPQPGPASGPGPGSEPWPQPGPDAHPGAGAAPGGLLGRETEQEALAQLVTGRGFRAGLLYGDAGVGKTALLRTGLVPHLLSQEILAVYCEDIRHPVESLAQSLAAMTGIVPEEGESPLLYLDRVVVRSIAGKTFVFILDDVHLALASGNEQLIGDLGDLFARVVTRSGGRARFLFCCASAQVHHFGVLENRTGSLFPPSSRYELRPLSAEQAVPVLAHILAAVHPVATDPALATSLVAGLSQDSGILPATLQMAAVAVREIGIASAGGLNRFIGQGPLLEQLQRAWIDAGAEATGNRRAALRLLAELVTDSGAAPQAATRMAGRAGVDPGFGMHAMSVLQAKGLVRAAALPMSAATLVSPGDIAAGGVDIGYQLAEPSMAQRVREVAGPVQLEVMRWRDALAARARRGKVLTPFEYRALRTHGIVPATSEERAAIERTRRRYAIAGGVTLAAPILFLLVIYIALSGRYYLDVATTAGGPGERIVVRAGRPALSGFHWLPGSPSFGSIVADPGFTRTMVQPEAWDSARAGELTGELDGAAYAAASLDALTPTLRQLVDYASTGDEAAMESLRKAVSGPQDYIALLELLGPIARGGKDEVGLIEQALNDASPAVQASALGAAARAAQRRPGLYHETLIQALASGNEELRRLAFAAVRGLGEASAETLFQEALAQNPDPGARRELLAEVTAIDTSTRPSASAAASILVNSDISPRIRQDARNELRRAFATEPKAAALAAARLASDSKTLPDEQVFALELMRDLAPAEAYGDIAGEVKSILGAGDESVRAAALALYARIAPQDAAGELAVLLQKDDLSEPLRVASALAWGEVAKQGERAAAVALEDLLEDDSPRVRAAAAEAYGNIGRNAQDPLIKLIKTSRFDVAVGAAFGLANSIEVGASISTALGGISHMWRRKGRPQQAAAEVFARVARSKPRSVYGYLVSAVRSKGDSQVRASGAAGLCHASAAKHVPSQRMLARASLDTDTDVRRVVIQCVVDHFFDPEIVSTVAVRLSYDGDDGIRADAARALVQVVESGNANDSVVRAVLRLVPDRDRGVRALAARALAKLGAGNVPEETGKALQKAYERADEDEKLLLLETSRAIGVGELVAHAVVDESPAVRIAALATALATRTNVSSTMSAALTDSDAGVRRAALVRLTAAGKGEGEIDRESMRKSLRLALRDTDPSIAQLALTTLVRVEDLSEISLRLDSLLSERSERARVQAAGAGIGLVERDAAAAVKLLEPLLEDPSHDVRVAMLPALAAAYAASEPPEKLTAMLRDTEAHAMRRLAGTAAFLMLARDPAKRDSVNESLGKLAENAPPMVRMHARLALGLIESQADGLAFLSLLVP